MRVRALTICVAFFSVFLLPGDSRTAESPFTIRIEVDASEVSKRIIHSRLIIPASSGPLTLLYPRWVPGEHGPTGPLVDVAGLRIKASGRDLAWTRDPKNMHAVRFRVPDAANSVEVSLDFLLPADSDGFTAGSSSSSKLAVISWNQVLLYPEGTAANEITYEATLRIPTGWSASTALPVISENKQQLAFAPVTLETLIDSPVLCGEYFKSVQLSTASGPRYSLDIAADSKAALELNSETKSSLDRLVAEAEALFGTHPHSSYRFLLTLSDQVTHFGLEHHESSDDRVAEDALTDEDSRRRYLPVLPHELIHSWNGKYRRPADMIASDYNQPIDTELLWVYEGLTEYLTMVLTARSGLHDLATMRADFAAMAEFLQNQTGRSWRPLQDTTVAAQLLFSARTDGTSWRRSVDFYIEGIFLWLEADAVIRTATGGRRSLDDFCLLFFVGSEGVVEVSPYTLEDLIAALNSTAKHDWETFFEQRVGKTSPPTVESGLEKAGWKTVYKDTPPESHTSFWSSFWWLDDITDISSSIGILQDKDGAVLDVTPGRAASSAGIAPGMVIVAVNSRTWTPDRMREAISAATDTKNPIEIIARNGDYFTTHALDYSDGEKYAWLERIDGKPDLLTKILTPLTPAASSGR
jgi:predicted metalloprotease with PDZ domain